METNSQNALLKILSFGMQIWNEGINLISANAAELTNKISIQ